MIITIQKIVFWMAYLVPSFIALSALGNNVESFHSMKPAFGDFTHLKAAMAMIVRNGEA